MNKPVGLASYLNLKAVKKDGHYKYDSDHLEKENN